MLINAYNINIYTNVIKNTFIVQAINVHVYMYSNFIISLVLSAPKGYDLGTLKCILFYYEMQ